MWRLVIFFLFLNNVLADEENEKTRTVVIESGSVIGVKYWDGEFYEFYGIPYAEAPTGRDRYQAPLPVKPWQDAIEAKDKTTVCYQSYFTDEDDDFVLNGEEDCLLMSLLVPELASEDNLVPVIVYIHSGAFSGGNANMARFHYLARHDLIVASFNYRVGAFGFACLGNKEIPGNAGLKDQVAALRWIKRNIKKFGGDPNKVTLAGFSVGASMAELISLSTTTDGLINQLIIESGSALSPFAINRDPIATATNLAYAMGFNGTANLDELTEFYLEAPVESLAATSLNFFLPNSTFGFAPCIENIHEGIEPIITESPLDILAKGKSKKIPMIVGFANMEGISRTIMFGEWRERMTKDFTEFLPADLRFDSEKAKDALIKTIKQRYFQGNEVNNAKLQGYVDYFSAAMFKYSIMKSVKLHAAFNKEPLYLFEFSYIGKLNMQHNYMDRIKGAGHRDQTAYMLDFFGWTNSYKDLDMRDRLTAMWTDFAKYGNPTEYESLIINYKWLPYTNKNQYYLQIGRRQSMKKNLFSDEFSFWDKIYEKYHWTPTAPVPPKIEVIEKKQSDTKQQVQKEKVNNKTKKNIPDENKKDTNEGNKATKVEEKQGNQVKKEDIKVKQQPVEEKKVVKEQQKEETKVKEDSVKGKLKQESVKVAKEIKKGENRDKQETVKVNEVGKDAKKEEQKVKVEPVKVAKEIKTENKDHSKKDSTKEKKTDTTSQEAKK